MKTAKEHMQILSGGSLDGASEEDWEMLVEAIREEMREAMAKEILRRSAKLQRMSFAEMANLVRNWGKP